MAFWNAPDSGIRPGSRRPVTRRRPTRRPSPEALEGRCLLATTYTITDIAVISTRDQPWAAINNAVPAQVVDGNTLSGQAFIWDSVHGFQDLGTVNKEANSASIGVNDSGKVVGKSWTTTVKAKPKGYGFTTKTVEDGFLWT